MLELDIEPPRGSEGRENVNYDVKTEGVKVKSGKNGAHAKRLKIKHGVQALGTV